ncbi:MAG: AAA family ATPase [Candidatus Scalindua rubra]|uniref:ATP-dependent Clp protease ATP-binding subunit ClpL n=1 Tax=Candidatus Scalindua brodae TaxID=237368 RepID=A0A0B0EHC1_9BACT|nr:MAG: ATP-dependent Clp protease ATP-binding subunit ClpL [Candidatus Scalindua brodae]MBZ0107184.1 AAA family ATPase [Candidatus Scalindua rubra]TWU31622.1 ATP-dependent Clp protease ATP-binding subunit ClpL [Candidatus Brocadiaceae bacterium S225]
MEKKTVLVTGDVIIDHNIYQGKRVTPDSKERLGTMVVESPGGTNLLYRIISEVSKEVDSNTGDETCRYSVQFGLDSACFKELPAHQNAYALWGLCPEEAGSSEIVWRVVDPMGYGGKESEDRSFQPEIKKDAETGHNVVVIDDGGLGFRSNTSKEAWPLAIREENVNALDWVVLKMSSPVSQGDLWRLLSNKFMEKLVVIVSIDDIRCEEVAVNKGLSWEDSIQSLIFGLNSNTAVRNLMKCRHLVINFGSEGALWINNGANPEYKLIYDPERLEGEWSGQLKGEMFGNVSCLTAGIVNQLVLSEETMDIGTGIVSGLSAMRVLLKYGHGSSGNTKPDICNSKLADEITGGSSGYSITKIPVPMGDASSVPAHWTILGGLHGGTEEKQRSFYGLGRRVALLGHKVLNNIPYAKFTKLYTVDRGEIESLRSIKRLIMDYEATSDPARPLSIAVFGPPGSGKSFGVKQLANALFGDDVPLLEFNLAQFSESEELVSALHQVRDKVLEGTTPFVFWDEFDSDGLKWLQYLLAPMQDGKFLEGQINHPVGKCIFIFAGGTSNNMEDFENPEDKAFFKSRKGPDFVGRLHGYLNVLGPNRREKCDRKNVNLKKDDNPVDICFPLRRALILRVILRLKDGEEMDIDRGLLTAFLEIDRYKHGSRSLEKIVLLTKGPGSKGLMRSNLPSAEQLSLHVDYDMFMGLVNRDLPFKMKSEDLAPAVHEYYRQLGKKEGWAMEYDMNSADKDKDKNSVRNYPGIVKTAGYNIVRTE